VFSDKEQKYIYDDVGSNNSGGSRFCDGSTYIVYEFPVKATDKYVSLNWTIANQYAVYVCTTDPDDYGEWIPIYFLEKPDDAESADWSSFNMQNVTHDLSKYAPLCTQNKIWIIMGDSDPSGGWGGFISNSAQVVFKTSQKEPVTGAVAEYIPTIKKTEAETAAIAADTASETAAPDASAARRIDPERYNKPGYGIIGAVESVGLFAAVYVLKRSF
jgi:hypothetical protein